MAGRSTVCLSFVGSLLLAMLAAPAPGAEATAARRSRAVKLESADWVPLRGRVRVGRTWGHHGGHGYPAIDFVFPPGKSVWVYAAGPGTVYAASNECPDTTADGEHVTCNGGQGNLVEIVHPDGRRSRYLHLRGGTISVEPGEHVCRGCPIGRSGWSGSVSPPGPEGGHLHYEELRGFGLVNSGPMFARTPTGLVSYPGPGRRWQQVGREGLVFRNTGFPRPGPAPTASCLGWAATRIGTSGADDLRGSPGPDIIFGGEGSDAIRGQGGEDRLCGGAGDDLVAGGPHQDSVEGGDGVDTCFQDWEGGPNRAEDGNVASCERPLYQLTVEVNCCASSVSSDPAGISCPTDCTEAYSTNTVVRLTVTPPLPRAWIGCDSVQGATCTVAMVRDRSIKV